jgi:predicted phosphoribosyltransferase
MGERDATKNLITEKQKKREKKILIITLPRGG